MFSLIKTKQKIQTYSQQYTAPSVNVELFESKFKYFSRIMLHTYFYYLPLVVKPVSTLLQYADELKQTQVIIIFSSLLIKIMVTWCGPSSDSSPVLSLSPWTPSNCSARPWRGTLSQRLHCLPAAALHLVLEENPAGTWIWDWSHSCWPWLLLSSWSCSTDSCSSDTGVCWDIWSNNKTKTVTPNSGMTNTLESF